MGRYFSTISIKTMLIGVIGVICAFLAVFSTQALWSSYGRHEAASRVTTLTALDHFLFSALSRSRYERGNTPTALTMTSDKNQGVIADVMKQRAGADAAFAGIEQVVGAIDIPSVKAAYGRLKSDFDQVRQLRGTADADLKLPLESRDKTLPERVLAIGGKLLQTLEQASKVTENEIRLLNPSMSNLISARSAAWSARAYTGGNILMLNLAAAQSRPFGPQEITSFIIGEAKADVVWGQIREIVGEPSAPAGLKAAAAKAEASYFGGSFKAQKDALAQIVTTGGKPAINMDQWRGDLNVALDSVAAVAESAIDEMQASAAAASSQSLMQLIGYAVALFAALALGVTGNWLVRSRVIAPIRALTASMTRLAEGGLSADIPDTGRSDEIGGMAAAVRVFRENGLRVQALEAREKAASAERAARAESMIAVVNDVGAVVAAAAAGDFSARLKLENADGEMQKLVGGINQINTVVDQAVTEFAEVLGGIAGGDLTRVVATAYQGRFAELKASINETVARLSETVGAIQATTGEVSVSAREIKSGADDLARRTEEQAASLEETAATTEELAASVKASASSSKVAAQASGEAMSVAEKGGTIVREAVEAMERIEQASRKIADITSVIDAIAFQTNLLALNAAVEAARAGDAGKGFAVVASEVRTLAQRSGEASKDITGLIASSTSAVAQGVSLVRAAGEALEKIVTASKQVAATVSEISAASGEQAHGIDEMSQTVAHMDGMTQQNAALAEESAASAAALANQIEQLDGLVAAFKTNRSGNTHAAPRTEPERLRQLAAAAMAGTRPAQRPAARAAPAPAPASAPRRSVTAAATATAAKHDEWEEF